VKIIFIGTSSAQTSLTRFHSSILLSSKNYNLLIDTGDGISRALLFHKINYNQIDGILITHFHPDHFSGLPSLLVQMKIANRKKPLDVFIHQRLKEIIKENLVHYYILLERMNFKVDFKTFDFDEKLIISNDFKLLAKENSHLLKLKKHATNHQSIQLQCVSVLFEEKDKKLLYTSDIGSKEDLFLFRELSPDFFICEANHLELPALFEEIQKIRADKIYLTHYSEEDLKKISAILATLAENQKSRIIIAKDGLFFEI